MEITAKMMLRMMPNTFTPVTSGDAEEMHYGPLSFTSLSKASLSVSRMNPKNNKYLARVYSQVVHDVVFRLNRALGFYFAGLTGFLKFRRKGRYLSFTYPQIGGFKLLEKMLLLPTIGNRPCTPLP